MDGGPQMLLVCEHMAEPEIAFTIWAVPVMAGAETVLRAYALPLQLNLPQVQMISAAILIALDERCQS